MKKKKFGDYIRYWVDRAMSKGPFAMSLLLLIATTIIVTVIGTIAFFVSEDGGLIYQLWNSFMHTLDAGTLAGNATDNIPYVFLMALATLCGLCLTSVLISIVSTGVENKLSALRKGTSVVQEQNHTVIVGFDNNVYTLLNELIEANQNHKKSCVVVLGDQPKVDMEDAIAARITDTKTTTIICRSGKLHEPYALGLCAVEAARSVIVNIHDDAETIKILLALSTYLKDKKTVHPDLHFVAYLQEKQHKEAALIAGGERALVICIRDTVSRIIANTCRQHGLSQVLTELFNFSGDELYIEQVPQLEGKTFREALLSFSNAVAVGLCAGGRTRLNPPMETVLGKGDGVVLLEEDDGAFVYHPVKRAKEAHVTNTQANPAKATNHLVVLGSNGKLPIILAEYDRYVPPHTHVTVVDNDWPESRFGEYTNLEITLCTEKVNRRLLSHFVEQSDNNLLLLNDDSIEPEASDSQTLMRLILLRDIADSTAHPITITTEMHNADNQRLASQARVDDFVIGTDFVSLLMVQISEEPRIAPMIRELLDEDGSELYLKPAYDYVPLGVNVDGYDITESAARKGEVYVGYRRADDRATVINPNKEDGVVFGERDMLVVVAEN